MLVLQLPQPFNPLKNVINLPIYLQKRPIKNINNAYFKMCVRIDKKVSQQFQSIR